MKIKLKILLFVLTMCSINLVGQIMPCNHDTLKNEIYSLRKTINEVNARQNYQDTQINNQVGMLDTAFDGVSAEISASSNYIGIFGICIAVLCVALSIYVSKIEKNVKAMRGDNEILLLKNIQIKEDLETLSDKITKDSNGLYKLVRNEESNHIINRLISVPEDIVNLAALLVTRDLEEVHFARLKEAFIQVKFNPKYDLLYVQIFHQHFSGKAILDDDIKPIFLKWLNQSFSYAFKNDAIKSASDYFNAILEKGLNKSIEEINEYVIALCKSQFTNEDAVYYAILNEMKNQELKFQLYDFVRKEPATLIFRQKIGKLITEFKFEKLTVQENAILTDINSIIQP